MASAAIFLTIIIHLATASGFSIGNTQPAFPPAAVDYRTQPIAGYPKVPPPNAYESGGSDDDLLPPFEHKTFKRSVEDVKVDPKTGYPLVADPSWRDAGGNEENLEPPLDDSARADEGQVDPKTGYPLFAQPHWKDAGGDEKIIALPLEATEENFGQKEEEEEAVDPKTGYPLKANPSWRDAGGDGEILQPPIEDPESAAPSGVDPKTGYPLLAEESWKYAGGDGEILEPPAEEPKEAVDPKTGYPLLAQPGWKDAGGDGDILELPLEDTNETAVDPKTGYPLTAQPEWKFAGGDGDVIQPPLEYPEQAAIDPRIRLEQRTSEDAGGNILQPSVKPSEDAVDPKTGYPLFAQPEWKHAGGDENILELPLQSADVLEQPNENPSARERSGREQYHVFEIFKLTELQPPPLEKSFPTVFSNSFSTPSPFERNQGFSGVSPAQNQKRDSSSSQPKFGFNNEQRPIESSYTYVGPENVIVTVTRFLNTDRRPKLNGQQNGLSGFNSNFQQSPGYRQVQNNPQRSFNFHGSNGIPAHFSHPIFPQTSHQNFSKRLS